MSSAAARLSTLINARVAALLDRAEDPAEILDDSYRRQLESLKQVRSGIADTVSAKKRLQTQEAQLERAVVTLDTQARQALSTGGEQLARAALERRNVTQTELRSLDREIIELEGRHDALVVAERKLSAKVEAFRTAKERFQAQYSAAEAQARVAGAATGVGEEMADVGLAMRRARGKTAEMAARAELLAELEGAGSFEDLTTLGAGRDDIDRRLAELSSSIAVDDAIAELKAELLSATGPGGRAPRTAAHDAGRATR